MSTRKFNLYTATKEKGNYDRDKLPLPAKIYGLESDQDNCYSPPDVTKRIDPTKKNFLQINVQGRLYNNDGEKIDFFRDKECKSFAFVSLPLINPSTPSTVPSTSPTINESTTSKPSYPPSISHGPTNSTSTNCEIPDCAKRASGYKQCCGDHIFYECELVIDEVGNQALQLFQRSISKDFQCCQRGDNVIIIKSDEICPLPTRDPSSSPSDAPSTSLVPSTIPTLSPSLLPTLVPSPNPSYAPSISLRPSVVPTMAPSSSPSDTPSSSSGPSSLPTVAPSSTLPTLAPSLSPSNLPSSSSRPSIVPTTDPSFLPSVNECLCAWKQEGDEIIGEALLDLSGDAVSLSDDGLIVAIGAINNDGNTADIGDNQGHVRVYKFNGHSWIQLGEDIDGGCSHDQFGHAVFLSGDGTSVAIGAPKYDGISGSNEDTGNVRVYKYNGMIWQQVGQDIIGENMSEASGQSVALSYDGDIVAIGSPGNNAIGERAGTTRIYELTSTDWLQRGMNIDGEAAHDYSGYSVSLSKNGSVVAIGAVYNDGNGEDAGHVRIYNWSTANQWDQIGSDIDGQSKHDNSGYSVSLSSDGLVIAIGAPKVHESKGHVRVFEYDGLQWAQQGGDLNGSEFADHFGEAVSISGDGRRLAVGAPATDTTLSGLVNNGEAKVYEWNPSTNTWETLGDALSGKSLKDKFGSSVSLSKDGLCLAVGGPNHDIFDNASVYLNGHVRIFRLQCNNHCSAAPSGFPSFVPTVSVKPSGTPSKVPSTRPSIYPSVIPSTSMSPSNSPSEIQAPTSIPSRGPSSTPSTLPSNAPSGSPSLSPSEAPTLSPSRSPSCAPSTLPSIEPSQNPSVSIFPTVSMRPSAGPYTIPPSSQPSDQPTVFKGKGKGKGGKGKGSGTKAPSRSRQPWNGKQTKATKAPTCHSDSFEGKGSKGTLSLSKGKGGKGDSKGKGKGKDPVSPSKGKGSTSKAPAQVGKGESKGKGEGVTTKAPAQLSKGNNKGKGKVKDPVSPSKGKGSTSKAPASLSKDSGTPSSSKGKRSPNMIPVKSSKGKGDEFKESRITMFNPSMMASISQAPSQPSSRIL